VRPIGVERTEAIVSYFIGSEEDWKARVPTYAGVVYKDLWPGIDLEYSGTSGRLKYTLTVAPGADPTQVRLAYRGASGVRVSEQGRLEIETPAGGFAEDVPYVYQVDGRQVEVASAYQVEGETFGFRLGDYDRNSPLALDPPSGLRRLHRREPL
jgi:hypothetical protein